jgi:hypothetical protein
VAALFAREVGVEKPVLDLTEFTVPQREKLKEIRLIASLPERVISGIKAPYPLIWILAGQLLFFAMYAVQKLLGEETHLGYQFMLSLLFVNCTIGVIWCSRQFERFLYSLCCFLDLDCSKDKITSWYKERLRDIFENRQMLAWGIGLALLMVVTLSRLGLLYNSLAAKVMYLVFWIVVCFFGGTVIFSGIRSAVFVVKLSKLPIRISIHQHPLTSIKALGDLYFKMALYWIVTYCIALLVARLSPYGFQGTVLLWVVPVGLFVLVWFVLPQIEVHRLMFEAKQLRIRALSSHLETALTEASVNPTPQSIARLKDLFELQQHLNSMSEWPFNTRMILTILTAIVIPMIVLIIELFVTK